MATCTLEFDSEGYAKFPPDTTVEEAKEILKPAGILSNAYNKQGLKKVERRFIPAKGSQFSQCSDLMHQTNYMPPVEDANQMEYFHIKTERTAQSLYDRMNSVTEGYDQKLHRDDRHHTKLRGLHTHEEECRRAVPMTSNALYGHTHRVKLERNRKEHCHRELCKEDFNSRNGINLSS